MQITTKFTPKVTRDDALSFLGSALRNWDYVPPFTNDDADDVAGALASFLKLRGYPEIVEALEAASAFMTCAIAQGCYSHDELSSMARATRPTVTAALAKARGEVVS